MQRFSLFNNKRSWMAPFFAIWTGQAFSLLGSQLVQFALIWWLTKTTGSATVLATASLVGLLPQVLLSPVAGAMVDRWSRRAVMMLSDGTVALTTLALAGLFLSGRVEIWHVYLAMLLRSMAGSFHWPAMQASTSLMVPKENLARVQGVNQILMGGMNIASAPLGALLLELLPVQGVLAIDVGTALLAILPLVFISVPQPAVQGQAGQDSSRTSVWEDLKAGLIYVKGWPGLVMILVIATIINLVLNPGFALLPLLVTGHFKAGALQLAWMQSAWGVGVMGGGLLLSVWGGFRRRILTSLLGLLLIGGGSLVVGVSPSSAFLLALAAMFVMGVGNPITNGPLMAVVQACVAPEMQGRVFTLIISTASAMTPLGLLIAGPLAELYGVQMWFITGGVVTALMGAVSYFIPAIIHIEDGRHPAANDTPGVQTLAPTPGD
jgi:DHA3 family macrolide efflux protein-like MFS transporter